MKNAVIYGEFLEESTTGIAYINSLLEKVLCDLVMQFQDSANQEQKTTKIKEIVNKKFYLKDFIKIILGLLRIKKKFHLSQFLKVI